MAAEHLHIPENIKVIIPCPYCNHENFLYYSELEWDKKKHYKCLKCLKDYWYELGVGWELKYIDLEGKDNVPKPDSSF